MKVRSLVCAASVLLLTPTFVAAQFIGGGTPDMNNGAQGINQPSSYEGQRTVRSTPSPSAAASAEDGDAMSAPAPAAKKKAKVARKKIAAAKTKSAAPAADKAAE